MPCQRHSVTEVRFNADMGIGKRIRERRQALKMSVKTLASKAGIAVSTLYDLERGDSNSTKQLHRVAIALKCSLHWLESGKGKPEPSATELLLTVAEAGPRHGWPFDFEYARFERLTADERAQIEGLVLHMLKEFERRAKLLETMKSARKRHQPTGLPSSKIMSQ